MAIRKFRGSPSTCSSRIDEVIGSQNIAEHFGQIYKKLYNNVSHGPDFEKVIAKINDGVNFDSVKQLERVTESVIQDALNSMKAKKSDAIFDVSSDFFINGPPELAKHLTYLIRTFLSHSCVLSE